MICGGSIRESPTNHHRRTRQKPLRSSVIRLPSTSFCVVLDLCRSGTSRFKPYERMGCVDYDVWRGLALVTTYANFTVATVMQRASPSGGEKGSTKKRGMHCSASTLTLGLAGRGNVIRHGECEPTGRALSAATSAAMLSRNGLFRFAYSRTLSPSRRLFGSRCSTSVERVTGSSSAPPSHPRRGGLSPFGISA
jgi:hypothetical protein